MKPFAGSGLGKLLMLGALFFAVASPILADDYVVIFKDPSIAPPNDEIGAGNFTVTNYPSPATGVQVPVSISFMPGTGLGSFSGTARAFVNADWRGDGLCTDFNKSGTCAEWCTEQNDDGECTATTEAACPDPGTPQCDKSLGEGGGPSRVSQLFARGGLSNGESPPSQLFMLPSAEADSTGTWSVSPPIGNASTNQGTFFIRNTATVSEPSLVWLLLAGGGILAMSRRWRPSKGN